MIGFDVATDELVEVTRLGSPGPEYIVVRTAQAIAEAQARALYVAGRIDVDELEHRLDVAYGLK